MDADGMARRAAPRRETPKTRGYSRQEMAEIGGEYIAYRESWKERFRSYMDALAVADSETEPAELTKRARALVDAEEAELRDRFGEE